MIEFVDFSCYYKLKKGYGVALDKISLTVADGERVAVVGPSGSGKTTLLKCILDSVRYTEGTLRINGTEVGKYDKRKNELAYVSQEYVLYPKMTVYQNIAYPLKTSGMSYEQSEELVLETAKKFGLYRLLTRKPKQLSGGQQQAVAIARALVKKPQIVLLDEPLSNLDASRRLKFRRIINDICAENKSTVIYVTHDPEEACFVAEKIVLLEEGEIKGIMSGKEYAAQIAAEKDVSAALSEDTETGEEDVSAALSEDTETGEEAGSGDEET